MQKNALQVQGLTKHYPNFALENVSFALPAGTIMGFIGENGAGKTTAIHAILDMIQKDAGTVTFWGKELKEDPKPLKEDIGVVFDQIHFYKTLTPPEVEKICRSAYKQWNTTYFWQLIERFELPKQKEIQTFSKGMKMMLSIAAALSHNPKLLILDEVTGGLDPIKRDEILDLFLEFVQDEAHSILVSSHITTDLEKIADYITFVHKGKLLFSKPKDELIYRYGVIRCGAEQFSRMKQEDMVAFRKHEYNCDVLVKDRDAARRKYKDVVIDPVTIEEMMLLYVKGEVL